MDLTEIKLKLPIDKLGEALGIKIETTSAKYATALCPFHHDTTPSFTFDRFSQTCRCFSSSCADIGRMDHVALIMRYEQLPREMAVDRLYQLSGEDRPISSLHEILGRVLSKLMLNVDTGDAAPFFKSRGISPVALREMQVGYSPSFAWFKEITSDLPMEEAAKLEFFRVEMFDNAIIYPTFDGLGRPAGFRARNFGAFTKYIANNKDFPLKPSRVYGQHLVKGRQIVLVEGPNDVLAMRSAGFKNVGGLMGLNMRDVGEYLSESGYSDIVLLADGDAAGEQAIMKAPNLIRVNQIPNGQDPDEFLAGKGIAGLTEMGDLINKAKYPFESKLEARLVRASTETLTGKIMLIKAIAKDMSEGLPPIIIMKLRDRIADALQIPKDEVESIFALADYDTTDLEEKIVWHVFENGEYTPDITSKVAPSSISNVRQRKAYQEMIDGLSATEQPAKREGLTKGDLDKFIDIANRRYIKKILTGATSSVLNLAEPLDEVMSKTMNNISTVVTEDIQVVNSAQQLDFGIQNAIERSKDPNKLLGISFGEGFTKMDSVLQGLRPQSTYILAAKQGSGKSALGMDWAINMAFHQKVPTLWISLEMSELDMSIRLLSKLTGIGATRIMTGTIDPLDIPKLAQQAIQHGGAPFYVANCGVLSINQIVALVRKYKIKHDIQAVFIDYIQLIDSGVRFNSMFERVGHISRMIKSAITMDRAIALPVVAIAQLNRAAAKHDTPTAEDIGESYKISQDADVVMTLRQRSEAEIEKDKIDNKNLGNAILNIDKNRSGIDKIICPLIFNKENLRFREVLQ
jgi:replicative DNA helicase